jgi:hypothetical protein
MPIILTKFGYRTVLLVNTILMGSTIALFATIGPGTPVLVIVIVAVCFGFLASLQYTSMNTLVYADVGKEEASMASTIASTLQQMSMSFGVAAASLATAVFIPDRLRSDPAAMVSGVHSALVALGGLTILSALVFRELKPSDGTSVSQYALHTGE